MASRSRVGNSMRDVIPSDSDHVVFNCPSRLGKLVVGTAVVRGHTWRVIDFGDTIPEVVGDPIGDLYGKSLTERNKCLLIHLAAAELCSIGDTDESMEKKFLEVMSVSRKLRVEQYKQAQKCDLELGEPSSNDPIIVAELRSHVHDILNPNHDRDHKTLLCFPVGVVETKNICLIRVTPSCLFSAHVTQPMKPSKEWAYLISFQGHMRLALPPSYLIGTKLADSPRTLSQPRGWESFLQFESQNSVGVDVKVLGRCPTCQVASIRLPVGVEGTLVGRSMIPDEAQLRSFHIEKPWAKRAAEEVGQLAVLAWELENDTPPLDEPPKLSLSAQAALNDLLEVIPGPQAPFSMKVWQQIAARSDRLVGIVGDVFVASHAYLARWRATREPTTMTPGGLKVFQGLVEEELLDYAMDMATFGVKPKGNYPPVRTRQQAYASANDDPTATASELWSDLVNGRLFLISDNSEQATGDLMESKLTFVTQPDITNPGCAKTRYISDPRVAVNERVFGENHPACIVTRHQHVARRLMLCKRRYPGIPVLLSKRDVKSAFKLIPIAVFGLPYMGCRFSSFICIYLALFFGWRPSPANWGVVATLLMQYIASHRPKGEKRDGPEGLLAFQYVDDGAFIDSWVSCRPWLAPAIWESSLSASLGTRAVNKEKRRAEGNADTSVLLWGIDVCTESETFTLPAAKALRAQEFLASPDFDPSITRIHIKKIQELRGKLEHWSVCNRALATETRHVDRLLVTRDGLIGPKGSLTELKQAYIDFWDSLETMRIHLLTGTAISQSYSSSYSRVLSLEELLSFPDSQTRLVWLGSDATPERCASVDYTNKRFSCFSYEFCVNFMSEVTGLPTSDFPLIALAEYLSILCFLITRSFHYKHKILAYAGDNQNVVTWIKYRKPKK